MKLKIKSMKAFFAKMTKSKSKKPKGKDESIVSSWSPETLVKVVTSGSIELDETIETQFSYYGFEFGGDLVDSRNVSFSTMLDHLEYLWKTIIDYDS